MTTSKNAKTERAIAAAASNSSSGGGGELAVTGSQTIGGNIVAAYTKGNGTVIYTKTPIGGGTTVDVGNAVAHGTPYPIGASDRGFIISARPVSYLPAAPSGLAVPTVAPLAPTIAAIAPASNTSVSVTVTRNVDNGGDTVVEDRVYIFDASNDNQVGTAVGSGTIVVTGQTKNMTVYARASTRGSTNGLGPMSAKSINTVIFLATRNNGVSRLFGTQENHADPQPLAYSVNGYVYKIQAPGAAIGARISVHNRSVTLGTASVKASMAPTDIAAKDTVANAYNAQVNNVINNTAASPRNTPNGFVKATWNGQAQSRRLYPTDAVLPSFGYNNQEDTVTSDIIQLPGYTGSGAPILARDRTPEEYYFILRLTVNGVVAQDGLSSMDAAHLNALYTEWSSSNGADTTMIIGGNVSGNNSDAVDGPYPMPGATGNGYPPMISIEWIYPATITPITFLHCGDSLIEGYKWPRLAVARKSTPQRPLHHINLGGSTTRTESFLGNLYLYLQNQARPDYMLMEIISPNNYSPTSTFAGNIALADVEYNRLVEVAQTVSALGIKLIWWVPVNYSPKVNPTDPNDETTSWNKLYNKAKKYAAANGIAWVDINGDVRNNWSGTLYNASTNPTGWNGDGTHPSPVGIEGFATIYGEALTTILGA